MKHTEYLEYTANDELVVFVSASKKTLLLPGHFKVYLDYLRQAFPATLGFSILAETTMEQFDISMDQVADDLNTLIRAELVALSQ
ncbi:hypothetical protein HBA55_08840 [Pseudomaricurvus alkylphenolicus]|uniref:hypothetical protein n=1 Tax=Pseudomaricurvus alkylphenolicus TaxID=1306991 RepID=UPI00141F84D3|nr:hypothetical protein [Pseudomaricurvus alkylphenolicus]NIB39690.1 hypothetical protein [Pseudomaricurvus alkylphenolicus]